MKTQRILALALTCLLLLAITACQAAAPTASPSASPAGASTPDAGATAPAGQATEEPAAPSFEGVELTYWMELNATTAQVVQEMGQTEYAKQLQERTGISIKYQHPAAGQARDAFNILIASGDYPDIIEYTWAANYPGGPAAAINNNVILPLNDVFEQNSPNMNQFLGENPEIDKMLRTDEGQYYVYPFLRGTSMQDNPLLISEGFVIRTDYLEAIGKELPETPQEWYDVLTAFKTELNVPIPVTVRGLDHLNRMLQPGFDAWHDFYVEDGVVKHGLLDAENRKAFITEAAKWYAEGLLDSDYLVVDRNTQASKILNSESAVTWAPGGSGIGQWIPAFKEIDPNAGFSSAPPMTPERGRNAKFSQMNAILDGSGAAITTSCKNVEAAAHLLDYNYGQEGLLLANFGIEGVSYEMVDGEPIFTDLVLNNPDGKSITDVMSVYIRAHLSGPFVQDARELMQYYQLDEQRDAMTYWTQTDMGLYKMPPVTPVTEESEEIAQIINNVKTYNEEMEAKFIAGLTPLSEFDAYIEQLKTFKLERAIEIYQEAYDRYMSR
jgi:putative aldouronate transport system substrate-binding protein